MYNLVSKKKQRSVCIQTIMMETWIKFTLRSLAAITRKISCLFWYTKFHVLQNEKLHCVSHNGVDQTLLLSSYANKGSPACSIETTEPSPTLFYITRQDKTVKTKRITYSLHLPVSINFDLYTASHNMRNISQILSYQNCMIYRPCNQ